MHVREWGRLSRRHQLVEIKGNKIALRTWEELVEGRTQRLKDEIEWMEANLKKPSAQILPFERQAKG